MWGCSKDLSTFLFGVGVDITELVMDGVLSYMLYSHDLVLMNETTEGLKNKFWEYKEFFDSKDLKVDLGKTKEMVSGSVAKDGLSKRKVDRCGIRDFRLKTSSVLYVNVLSGFIVDALL